MDLRNVQRTSRTRQSCESISKDLTTISHLSADRGLNALIYWLLLQPCLAHDILGLWPAGDREVAKENNMYSWSIGSCWSRPGPTNIIKTLEVSHDRSIMELRHESIQTNHAQNTGLRQIRRAAV